MMYASAYNNNGNIYMKVQKNPNNWLQKKREFEFQLSNNIKYIFNNYENKQLDVCNLQYKRFLLLLLLL